MEDNKKYYIKGPRTGVNGQWGGIPHEHSTRVVDKPILVTLKPKKKKSTKK